MATNCIQSTIDCMMFRGGGHYICSMKVRGLFSLIVKNIYTKLRACIKRPQTQICLKCHGGGRGAGGDQGASVQCSVRLCSYLFNGIKSICRGKLKFLTKCLLGANAPPQRKRSLVFNMHSLWYAPVPLHQVENK